MAIGGHRLRYWTALPPSTPAAVRTVLRRCLQKDAQHRLHHIADARLELDETAMAGAESPSGAVGRGRWTTWTPWIVAAVAVGAALVASRTGTVPREAADDTAVTRLQLILPAGVELTTSASDILALDLA